MFQAEDLYGVSVGSLAASGSVISWAAFYRDGILIAMFGDEDAKESDPEGEVGVWDSNGSSYRPVAFVQRLRHGKHQVDLLAFIPGVPGDMRSICIRNRSGEVESVLVPQAGG